MTTIQRLVMLSGMVAIGASARGATFQGVGDLPGGSVSSSVRDISAAGNVVVGVSASANGSSEAFRWTLGVGIVGLGDLAGGAFASSAAAASGDGAYIVGYGTGADGETATRWDAVNGMVALSTIAPTGPVLFSVQDVSADGTVMTDTLMISGDITAMRWDPVNGAVAIPGDLSNGTGEFGLAVSADGSVIAGVGSFSSANRQAFRWDSVNGMVELESTLSDYYAEALDVNSDGSVIVGFMNFSIPGPLFSSQRAFRWTAASGMVDIGNLGSNNASQARAVSADGTVIVGSGNVTGGVAAFIWREGIGMQRLSTVLTTEYGLDLTGWSLNHARGVSADGMVIVGDGTNPSGQPEGWIANLRAPAPVCAGDVTGDGETNISDFNVLSLNFGQSVAPNTNGDLTGDGLVNIADFNILAGDFGCGAE